MPYKRLSVSNIVSKVNDIRADAGRDNKLYKDDLHKNLLINNVIPVIGDIHCRDKEAIASIQVVPWFPEILGINHWKTALYKNELLVKWNDEQFSWSWK